MQGFPVAKPGQVVGLLGGSFDPPHSGHVHISKAAIKHFRLDQLWWVVSPGNPMKTRGPAPMEHRLQASRALMRHPRVRVTDIEEKLGTRYTAETLAAMQRRYQGVHFVWIMGADNLVQFHRWQNWRWIIKNFPIGVIARPGDRISARLSRAARMYRAAKQPKQSTHILGFAETPSWAFVNLPMSEQSSSAIRNRGEWV